MAVTVNLWCCYCWTVVIYRGTEKLPSNNQQIKPICQIRMQVIEWNFRRFLDVAAGRYHRDDFPMLIRGRVPLDLVGHHVKRFEPTVVVDWVLSSKLKQHCLWIHFAACFVQSIAEILTPLLLPVGHVVGAEFAVAVALARLTWNVSFYTVLGFWAQVNAYMGACVYGQLSLRISVRYKQLSWKG